jgi:flagellar motor switch protein FliN/FliY
MDQAPQTSRFESDPSTDHESHDEELIPVDPALRRFFDLPLSVRIELDRKRITLGDAMALREQMVIPLDRSAGENVDLLLDGMRIGNGEIVVIEDTMGLRLTDLRRDLDEEQK